MGIRPSAAIDSACNRSSTSSPNTVTLPTTSSGSSRGAVQSSSLAGARTAATRSTTVSVVGSRSRASSTLRPPSCRTSQRANSGELTFRHLESVGNDELELIDRPAENLQRHGGVERLVRLGDFVDQRRCGPRPRGPAVAGGCSASSPATCRPRGAATRTASPWPPSSTVRLMTSAPL